MNPPDIKQRKKGRPQRAITKRNVLSKLRFINAMQMFFRNVMDPSILRKSTSRH